MSCFHLLNTSIHLCIFDGGITIWENDWTNLSHIRELVEEQNITAFRVSMEFGNKEDVAGLEKLLTLFEVRTLHLNRWIKSEVLIASSVTRLTCDGGVWVDQLPHQLEMLKCPGYKGDILSLPSLHSLWCDHPPKNQIANLINLRCFQFKDLDSGSEKLETLFMISSSQNLDADKFPNLHYLWFSGSKRKITSSRKLKTLISDMIPDFPVEEFTWTDWKNKMDHKKMFEMIPGLRKYTKLNGRSVDVYGTDSTLSNLA
jgi:hypothetical protein